MASSFLRSSRETHIESNPFTVRCIFLQVSLFELYRFGPIRNGFLVRSCAFEPSLRLLATTVLEDLFDSIVIAFPVIAQIGGQCTGARLSVHVLVDAGGGSVREQGLLVQIVVLIVSEPGANPRGLVEKPLVIQCVPRRRRLSLAKGYLLRDVSLVVPFFFRPILASHLHPAVPFVFFAQHATDLISLPLCLLHVFIVLGVSLLSLRYRDLGEGAGYQTLFLCLG